MADRTDQPPTEMPEREFRKSDAFRELAEIKRQRDRQEAARVREAASETLAGLAAGRPSLAPLTAAVAASRGRVRRAIEWAGIVIGLAAVAALLTWGTRA